ncbi:hypothetical protein [Xenorhabdus sp. SGI240]|uniref:alpha/beta fold hydrolase n=1 Tax=Xenorhabdus sp. SGI240 TaxID=3158262 RepID=UPI0032B87A50
MVTTHHHIHHYNIRTRYANISVIDTGGNGLPVLLIHGNSSCKEIFRHQINQLKGQETRLHMLALRPKMIGS